MKTKKYDGMDLKLWALFTMFIDHIGAVLIETTYLYNIESFQVLNVCLRLIGRLAFPLYAFLLAEGFLHTRSWKKYAGRLFLFALISEIPFDLAAFGELTYTRQNVFFTLFIGLLTMKGLEKVKEKKLAAIGVIGAGCICAHLLQTDYSYMGILLIVILYIFREEHKRRCIIGGVFFSYEITSVLAFLMMYRYSGEKGETNLPRIVFYGFYPMHLLLLCVIRTLFIS